MSGQFICTCICSCSVHECIINVHAYSCATQEMKFGLSHTSNSFRRLDEQVVGARASDLPAKRLDGEELVAWPLGGRMDASRHPTSAARGVCIGAGNGGEVTMMVGHNNCQSSLLMMVQNSGQRTWFLDSRIRYPLMATVTQSADGGAACLGWWQRWHARVWGMWVTSVYFVSHWREVLGWLKGGRRRTRMLSGPTHQRPKFGGWMCRSPRVGPFRSCSSSVRCLSTSSRRPFHTT
jgi:hypothetical protein